MAPDAPPAERPKDVAPRGTLREPDTSGVVQGVTSVGKDDYKTEFVKVYQDAGVIGVAMITLLALCVLMGIFSLRLLKMYIALTESRDKIEATRSLFSEKLVERLMSIDSGIRNQRENIKDMMEGQQEFRERVFRIEVALGIAMHNNPPRLPDRSTEG